MKFKKSFKVIINLICSFALINPAFAEVYVVQNGDVLSKILFDKKIRPIYGKNGSIEKVIALNEVLKNSNGHLIYPGMKLNLDISSSVEDSPRLTGPKKSSPTPDKSFSKKQEPAFMKDEKDSASDQDSIKQAEHAEQAELPVKKKSRSDLGIAGISEFVRIKASDSNSGADATLLSEASPGFRLTWGQNWSEQVRSYLSYQSLQVSIQDSSSTTKTLNNKQNSITEYKLGVDYNYSPKWQFSGAFNYGEFLVCRALNSTTIVIEKMVLPSVQAGISYTLYQIDDLSVKALGSLSLVMPSKHESYDSKLSFGKRIGIGLSDSIESFKIDGELYFQNTDLKMENAGYDESNLGIMIGISKRFGTF